MRAAAHRSAILLALFYVDFEPGLRAFDSETQFDFVILPKQTARAWFAVDPQKLHFLGLNTSPRSLLRWISISDHQIYVQHQYLIAEAGMLTSPFSYKCFDAVTAHTVAIRIAAA
jgi:hypothetical protein